MAMDDPKSASSGVGLQWMMTMSKVPGLGEDYLRKMARQKILFGPSSGFAEDLVVRGEKSLMIAQTGSNIAQLRGKGAPVKFVKPKEGIMVGLLAWGVVKGARNPNAAKLWIDFVLSQEGQSLIAEASEIPLRPGIKAKGEELSLDGVKVLPLKTEEDEAHRADFVRKAREIFQ